MANLMKVQLARPDHPADPSALLSTLREIVMSGRWTQGEYASSFEQRVAEACGSIYAVSTNSGTSALEAICQSVGVGLDAEVICPSYTFVATVNAILSSGATPIFAEIDPRTFNMDLKDVEKRITKKTKGIILVHQFGIPADGAMYAAFCKEHGLALIEDAACGMGSTYNGKSVGTFGIAGLLSFHPRKLLSTGEGGMILTDNAEIADQARSIGNHGRPADPTKPSNRVGHNYRMSEFQAALGLWALDHLSEAMARRIAAAKVYDQAFEDISEIKLVTEPPRGVWNRQSYPIRVPGDRRNIIADALRRENIETSYGPIPASVHPYIEHLLHPPRLAVTETIYAETLLLPMHAALTPKEQDHVIATLKKAVT